MENTNIKKSQHKLLVDELIEDKELDQKIVKTFYSKDSLSSDIFDDVGGSYVMNEGVRDNLIKIADTFIDFIGLNFFIYDIILVGSLANYNWSEYSDVDLHVIMDIDEFIENKKNSKVVDEIMREFFKSKKKIWNDSHSIKIKGYDVEVYVQDIDDKPVSSGVYSILNNKWISVPQKGKENIDEKQIIEKGEEYASIIDDLSKKSEDGDDVTTETEDVRKKLKKFRQSGLESGGEYSYENLTFKLLRRNGYVEKLINLKKKTIDKKLSVRQ